MTTFSSSRQSIGDLSSVLICSLNQVTATVGLQLDGAPAGLRIQVNGGGFMDPGSVRFVPAGSQDSTSFTFAINTSTFEDSDNHAFDGQWRSPSGGSVTMIKGVMNPQCEKGTTGC